MIITYYIPNQAVEPNTLKNITLGFIKKNEGLLKKAKLPNLLPKELIIALENANEEMTKTVILPNSRRLKTFLENTGVQKNGRFIEPISLHFEKIRY